MNWQGFTYPTRKISRKKPVLFKQILIRKTKDLTESHIEAIANAVGRGFSLLCQIKSTSEKFSQRIAQIRKPEVKIASLCRQTISKITLDFRTCGMIFFDWCKSEFFT